MMCVRMRGLSVLLLLFVLATSPAFAQRSPDGRPRPRGYPDTPTVAYGPTPDCLDPTTKLPVDCEWYGFAHLDYPVRGASCLVDTRALLVDASLIGYLKPYIYYWLKSEVFDPVTNTSYCRYGCFNMGTTSATPPTPAGIAPPPVTLAPPPPVTLTPPPPPPVISAPPPPRVVNAPPVSEPTTPPNGAAVPPSLLPAPPRAGVINLNAAGFARPVSGILSLVVSGALLVLNLLLC